MSCVSTCNCCGYTTAYYACYSYHMTHGFKIPDDFETIHRQWAFYGFCNYEHIKDCDYQKDISSIQEKTSVHKDFEKN
jgi:hypothetical protein